MKKIKSSLAPALLINRARSTTRQYLNRRFWLRLRLRTQLSLYCGYLVLVYQFLLLCVFLRFGFHKAVDAYVDAELAAGEPPNEKS